MDITNGIKIHFGGESMPGVPHVQGKVTKLMLGGDFRGRGFESPRADVG